MNTSSLQWLRKAILVANGLTFLGCALCTVVNIEWASGTMYGYTLNGTGGHNEFVAVYLGMWLGLTIGFFRALRHYHQAMVGDVLLTLVLLQGLARIYAIALYGVPPRHFLLFLVAETLSSAIGLAIRPLPGGATS